MNKLLVILGSTSTGKTDLALSLAKKFNGELVACDSRQVYQGLDIGTGKLPTDPTYEVMCVQPRRLNWEINGIKIWMYDVMDPDKQYTVYHYVKKASKVIANILKRGKLPIIIGGTGLYLKALLEGLPNLIIPVDQRLRENLQKISKKQLQEKLQQIALDKWKNLNESDRQNPRRLIRAIELAILSLRGVKRRSNLSTALETDLPSPWKIATLIARDDKILKIGLTAPREILYQRINERVTARIGQGMIEETKNLHVNGLSFRRMRQLGLEYGVLADYLEGKIKSQEELIKILQGKIHGFARRQLTWFKKEKHVCWFDITSKNYQDQVESKVNSWYHLNHDQKN